MGACHFIFMALIKKASHSCAQIPRRSSITFQRNYVDTLTDACINDADINKKAKDSSLKNDSKLLLFRQFYTLLLEQYFQIELCERNVLFSSSSIAFIIEICQQQATTMTDHTVFGLKSLGFIIKKYKELLNHEVMLEGRAAACIPSSPQLTYVNKVLFFLDTVSLR
jgi:hypothetical protein